MVAIDREGARNRPATERSDDQQQREPMCRMQEQMQFPSECEDRHGYAVIKDEMSATLCDHAQGEKRRRQKPEVPGACVSQPGCHPEQQPYSSQRDIKSLQLRQAAGFNHREVDQEKDGGQKSSLSRQPCSS